MAGSTSYTQCTHPNSDMYHCVLGQLLFIFWISHLIFFSFKDPRSYRLNITFVSFALNGKLQEIGTVNGAMFQMCNGSFQGKKVEIKKKGEGALCVEMDFTWTFQVPSLH